ncbi:MAG: hypothetical protein ACLUO4_04735 [Christensenellales bacterium]
MDILAPVATVAALGLLFGVLLGYASKKFAVEKDETEIKIRAFAGRKLRRLRIPSCDALAEAVAKESAAAHLRGKFG